MNEDTTPRKPRLEPEILPPDHRGGDGGAPGPRPRFVFIDSRSGRAIPLGRPSLFTLLVVAGMVGLVLAAVLVLVLGAFLVALPVLGLLFVGLLLGGLLRPRR